MTIKIRFAGTLPASADAVILPVLEGEFDDLPDIDGINTKEFIDILKNDDSFKGKAGQILSLPVHSKDKKIKKLIAFGLGKADELTHTELRNLGGKLYPQLAGTVKQPALYIPALPSDAKAGSSDAGTLIAFGALLRSYRYDIYRTKLEADKKPILSQITVYLDQHKAAKDSWDKLEALAGGVCFARDLVNAPPNDLYPESYAEKIKEELKPLGVKVTIIDSKKLEKMKAGAILAVGQGSARPPCMVLMEWKGKKAGKDTKPIALIGKGVTFDTGGISIKPAASMDEMKMDMGGSGAVVGAMKAIAAAGSDAHVIGAVGLAENMPSHNAYRPGDVIKSLSGQTIEVLNTDAEGRLVLADVLTHVQKTYDPSLVVDLATLTGAIMVALGSEYAGAFSNDDDLWESLSKASGEAGEKLWRMPLDKAYTKEVDSDIADMKNIGKRYGGACSAAAFLGRFIDKDRKWAHLDIAGTAWGGQEQAISPKGANGFGVHTLYRLVENSLKNGS